MSYIKDEVRKEKKEKLLILLPKMRFHISNTCKKIGIHRNTFSNWIKSDRDFKDRYEEIKQSKIDDSEERLYLLSQGIPKIDDSGKLIGWEVKPHFGALVTQLKAQAKERGYGDCVIIKDDKENDTRNLTDSELIAEMENIRNRVT